MESIHSDGPAKSYPRVSGGGAATRDIEALRGIAILDWIRKVITVDHDNQQSRGSIYEPLQPHRSEQAKSCLVFSS
jgi:hypothetical protein